MRSNLLHSAKGSVWEHHKYLKRIDGNYYYPKSYKGGRHLDSSGGASKSSERKNSGDSEIDLGNLSQEDVESLALRVIRGDYGNGQERKDKLGDAYQSIQNRVNEILLGGSGSSRMSQVSSSESVSSGSEKTKQISNSSSTKSTPISSVKIDMDAILSVYRNKK